MQFEKVVQTINRQIIYLSKDPMEENYVCFFDFETIFRTIIFLKCHQLFVKIHILLIALH